MIIDNDKDFPMTSKESSGGGAAVLLSSTIDQYSEDEYQDDDQGLLPRDTIHQHLDNNIVRHREPIQIEDDDMTEGLVSSKEIEFHKDEEKEKEEEEREEEEQDGANTNNSKFQDIFPPSYDSPPTIINLENTTTSKYNPRFKNYFSRKNFKLFTLVLLISNMGFGTFFSYTSAQSLSYTFYQTFSINSSQYGNLFTLYAIPNICMVFISGILVDIYGPDKISIILSTIVFISTMIGAFSPPNYAMMLFSRFLLGFAGESLVSCSNALMTKWIPERNLPICLGFLVGWIYFANLNSLVILPAINKSFGFRISLWFIFGVQLLCLSLNIFYLLFNKIFKEISKEVEMDELLSNLERNGGGEIDKSIDDYVFLQEDLDSKETSQGKKSIKQYLIESFEKVKFILSLIPLRMWIIFGIVFFGYTAMYALAIIGPDLFGLKYGYQEQIASLILSSETICSSFLSPIFGIAIKFSGRRIVFLSVAMVLLASGLLLLVLTPSTITPLPWIIICGTGFALLNTTVYSSLPVFIPQQVLGTSFGFIGTGYNLGLVVFPPILGALKVSSGNYDSFV
ncbi:hypothetical protein DFA_10045 [Cavenderia fasciculata]|uniref:Lysosomal dipeptide transporter MFSD1 n=1 Tax=Cavenderia fasciculata TaxID=261658 RepID=F4Q946_CACFS|nr:uncharacterized protein DFA_10045 [Cavenderia fasciculata]EGG15215.1 hypothetical protein DFA_10045 [Cavenderia fasciculata]|eukprot:XP_004351935.1 hypothetical protein DFA_10045 [Cavenderia fasciculata]